MEEWIQIYDFPGYEVSNRGRFKNSATGRILTPSSNGKGSIKIIMVKDGVPVTRAANRIVATAFHGDPHPGAVVVHLDDNHDNLDKDNLEWKPRWFAQERAYQAKRTTPMRNRRIRVDATGVIYSNSLECAKAIDGIEKYIVLCAGNPQTRRYMGSTYSWVD